VQAWEREEVWVLEEARRRRPPSRSHRLDLDVSARGRTALVLDVTCDTKLVSRTPRG